MFKCRLILIILFLTVFLYSKGQTDSTIVLRKNLIGNEKILFENYILGLKKSILEPENTRFWEKILVIKTNNTLTFRVNANAKTDGLYGEINDCKISFGVTYRRTDNNENDINAWSTSKFYFEQCYSIDDSKFFINDPQNYDTLFYTNIYCIVKKSERWGVLDSNSKIIVPIVCYEIKHHPLGLLVEENGKIKVLKFKENKLTENSYDYIEPIPRRLAGNLMYKAILNGKVGLIDEDFNEVIPFEYSNIEYEGNSLRKIKNGVIPKAKVITSIRRNNRSYKGIFDINKSKHVMEHLYSKIDVLSPGLFVYFIITDTNLNTFMLDDNLDTVINSNYTKFKLLENTTTWALKDKNGKLVLFNSQTKSYSSTEFEFEDLEDLGYGLIKVYAPKIAFSRFCGVISYENKIVVKPEFDNIEHEGQGIFTLTKNGNSEIFDTFGNLKK
jgi:hypothetical protein